MLPDEIRRILQPLYEAPDAACPCNLRFDPEAGWIPRCMFGAEAGLDKVRVIVVGQNPGHLMQEESATYRSELGGSARRPDDLLAFQERFGRDAHLNPRKTRDGRYHRELMGLLREILATDDWGVLRGAYFTEAVKCSTENEQARIPRSLFRTCIAKSLQRELALLPAAPVLALGRRTTQAVGEVGPDVAARTIYVRHPSWGILNRADVITRARALMG